MQNLDEHPPTNHAQPPVRRLALRSVTAGSARLSSLIGAGKSAWISIDDMPVQVRISPQVRAPLQEGCTICIDSVHGPVSVAPGDNLIRLLTGIDVPAAPEPAQLDRWIASVAVACMPPAWQELFGMRAVLPSQHVQHEGTLTLQLLPEQGNWTFTVQLSGSYQTLCAMAAGAGWSGAAVDQPLPVDEMPVSRPIVIGTTAVQLDRLSALARGDLVLLDKALFQPDGEGWIAFGDGLAMSACLLATGPDLQLQFNGWSNTMEDMDDLDDLEEDYSDDEAESAEEGDTEHEESEHDDVDHDDVDHDEAEHDDATSLDDLTVMLTFEVGTVERTVAQLRELTAGTVIRLPAALPPTVVVRCRHKEVARGELVEVEGRLAVQITETAGAP